MLTINTDMCPDLIVSVYALNAPLIEGQRYYMGEEIYEHLMEIKVYLNA